MVTVAIPVLNGERYLDEVLTAVRAQQIDREVEILIVDSGSSDRSVEIAGSHGAVLHQIRKEEFSHGGTRNRMMELASGDHVAFLTQDATPAHDGWLAALLEGFEQADDVAAVFGPHVPRPEASHMIKAEMERHFATWGDGREIDLQRLDRSPHGIAAYREFPGKLTFLSDVNSCIAKEAWREVPFREVPYAEDQLLGRDLIEAGWAKVFHPRAEVIHSHDYPPGEFFRRYFDEFRSLREVLGFVQPAGPKTTLWDIRGLTGFDKRWLERQGVTGPDLVRPLATSLRHHTIRMAGAIVGTRADRLPAPVRQKFSLEGRATFEPLETGGSDLLAPEPPDDGVPRPVFDEDWSWDFVRRFEEVPPLDTSPRPKGPMTLAWVVPSWRVGSGGHTTIFRLIQQLERRGHSSAIHVFDPFGRFEGRQATDLKREVDESFVPLKAEVFLGLERFQSADVAIATNWWTAYPVRGLPNCRRKAYLVQDDEPVFHSRSSASVWAEQTYDMGFRCIAYTPWMAEVLKRDYGVADPRWFECGTDLDVYTFGGPEGREEGLIAVYARQETGRRAVDLAVAGIATLYERRPGVRVVMFGSHKNIRAPFPATGLGVARPAELAELYRRASVGVVFSLTTHSLVAHEMMASGLPVVELEGENVTTALGKSGERVMLAEPTPDSIADALEAVLDDPERSAAMAGRARAFVEERTWERAGEQVESALLDFLAEPASP